MSHNLILRLYKLLTMNSLGSIRRPGTCFRGEYLLCCSLVTGPVCPVHPGSDQTESATQCESKQWRYKPGFRAHGLRLQCREGRREAGSGRCGMRDAGYDGPIWHNGPPQLHAYGACFRVARLLRFSVRVQTMSCGIVIGNMMHFIDILHEFTGFLLY